MLLLTYRNVYSIDMSNVHALTYFLGEYEIIHHLILIYTLIYRGNFGLADVNHPPYFLQTSQSHWSFECLFTLRNKICYWGNVHIGTLKVLVSIYIISIHISTVAKV